MPSPDVVPKSIQSHPASTSLIGLGKQAWLFGVILVVAVLALYYPVHSYPFVDIDDYAYVVNNAHVTGPLNLSTIGWAFTHPIGLNYSPLTFLAHNLDVQMFQLQPGWHHLVNVFLHCLDVVLLFWVLFRATGFVWRSFMVAALFAVHPIQVENVAWIAELKTLLSAVFFFLALEAYRRYAREPRLRRMSLVCLLYGLALLAKPQVITLPFVLLLWDYWPLRRMFADIPEATADVVSDAVFPPRGFAALLKEKIPLFIICVLDAILTMIAQRAAQAWPLPLVIRLGNAVLSYGRYVGMAFWPPHLALLYLHQGEALPWTQVWTAFVFLIAVSVFVIVKRRHRYLVVGWLWFVGTLVPMIGLVQVDIQALADRYAYISFIGLFLMVCWGLASWAEQAPLPKLAVPIASVAVLLGLSALTYRQVRYWSDPIRLWTHTLDVTHRNWAADSRLGALEQKQGKQELALRHFYRASEDRPREPTVNLNIALIEHARGNLRQAIPYYEKVLAVSVDDQEKTQVRVNLGHIYSDLGDSARARQYYLAAHQPLPPAPRPAINWRGSWWRDLGPFLRERYDEWKAGNPSAQ